MKIKKGVRVGGLQPEMILAIMIVEPISVSFGQDFCITSALDGKHSKTSRHPLGFAVDVRSRDMTDDARAGLAMQEALGDEYFVLVERNHIHIQFNGTQI